VCGSWCVFLQGLTERLWPFWPSEVCNTNADCRINLSDGWVIVCKNKATLKSRMVWLTFSLGMSLYLIRNGYSGDQHCDVTPVADDLTPWPQCTTFDVFDLWKLFKTLLGINTTPCLVLIVVDQNHCFWMGCSLRAFVGLWKTAVSLVMSICPSVSPHGTIRRPLDGISWNLMNFFEKLSRKICFFNPLTPNDPYRGRTAPLNSKVAFYLFIQQI
jgi:hypothetical protein